MSHQPSQLEIHVCMCVFQIYLFLWWWFLLVAVCTLLSLIYWSVMSVVKGQQRVFVHRYLRVYDLVKDDVSDRRALTRLLLHRDVKQWFRGVRLAAGQPVRFSAIFPKRHPRDAWNEASTTVFVWIWTACDLFSHC